MKKRRNNSEHTPDPVRTKLCFSQETMAKVLGLVRSAYAMYEAGERSLPQRARLVYKELKEFAEELPPLSLPSESYLYLTEHQNQTLVVKKQLAASRCNLLRHELRQKEALYRQIVTEQLHLQQLIDALPTDVDMRIKISLELQASLLNMRRISQTNVNGIISMRVSLAQYEAELKVYEAMGI